MIGFIHNILNVPDPSNSFFVSKLISGTYRVKPSFEIMLPITIQILDKRIDALPTLQVTFFYSSLFKAMYLFAFCTFARIGELTGHEATAYHVIQFGDVSFNGSSMHQTVTVTFRKYKLNTTGTPHMISFSRGQSFYDFVQALLDYIHFRGSQSGPLFCMLSGDTVKLHTFDIHLLKTLRFLSVRIALAVVAISLRIGAA